MNQFQKVSLAMLRIALGWLFLYSGVSKLMDPAWSVAGYLNNASTFPSMYHWLASPSMIGAINTINAWGQTLLGISLILGIAVSLSSILGAILMLLYYFPILKFPIIPPHSYIVDEHIIYAAALLLLGAFHAGNAWGLGQRLSNASFIHKNQMLRNLLR